MAVVMKGDHDDDFLSLVPRPELAWISVSFCQVIVPKLMEENEELFVEFVMELQGDLKQVGLIVTA